MDFRRSIILVALAVVSYMLILAWNEDYGQTNTVQKHFIAIGQLILRFAISFETSSNQFPFSVLILIQLLQALYFIGAAFFGIGWGIGGFCPGPALTAIFLGSEGILYFLPAMFVGLIATKLIKA